MSDPDIVTLKVPGTLAQEIDLFTADHAEGLDAAHRDLRAAWNTGSERRQGFGSVYTFDIPTELLGHFTDIVGHIHYMETDPRVDGHNRSVMRAAHQVLSRIAAEHGITPVPDGTARPYSGDDTPGQRARVAEERARRESEAAGHAAAQERQDREFAARRKAAEALTTAVTTVLDAAGHPPADGASGGYQVRANAQFIATVVTAVPDPLSADEERRLETSISAAHHQLMLDQVQADERAQVEVRLDAYENALKAAGYPVTRYTHADTGKTVLRVERKPPGADEVIAALRYLGVRSAITHEPVETGLDEVYFFISLSDMKRVLDEIPQERR